MRVASSKGTGMGMPIVKSLIELMGGTIEVTSELHAGTSFYVEIPLDIDKNPQARANTVEGALDCSLADMNVLLAEDNRLNAEIAQALLESEGVVVTRAANGNEVVDLYLSHPAGSFDAIPDGHYDAGHGRLRGNPRDSPEREGRCSRYPHHRAHRQCLCRGRQGGTQRRHERPSIQTARL